MTNRLMKSVKPKVSKTKPKIDVIKIRLKDGAVDSVVNNSEVEMFVMSQGGLFMMSNYPLTIECNTCKGEGIVGIIKKDECEECKGTGQIDLYKKK